MLAYMVILFVTVPLVELALLIKVGQHIGVMNTILIVALTGIAGAMLARREGLKALYGIQRDLEMSILPSERLLDGFLIFIGGVLLLTPGLVTDLIGFLLLMPASRKLAKTWLVNRFRRMIEKNKISFF